MDQKCRALVVALSDGLSGYLTYLARSGMSQAYSEYLLYEPVVRIAKHLGWSPWCERPVADLRKTGRGDLPRVDFVMTRKTQVEQKSRRNKSEEKTSLILEIKWTGSSSNAIAIEHDHKKIMSLLTSDELYPGQRYGAILIVGKHTGPKGTLCACPVPPLAKKSSSLLGDPIYRTCFRGERTRYGAMAFEVKGEM